MSAACDIPVDVVNAKFADYVKNTFAELREIDAANRDPLALFTACCFARAMGVVALPEPLSLFADTYAVNIDGVKPRVALTHDKGDTCEGDETVYVYVPDVIDRIEQSVLDAVRDSGSKPTNCWPVGFKQFWLGVDG
jgi:hypothetical protein